MNSIHSQSFEPSQRRVERISQAVVRVIVRNNGNGFESVRSLLLKWLQDKAGQSLTEAMHQGETDSLDLLGAQRVETVSLKIPQLWSARQDFQDRQVPRRTWVTEAMLASSNEQTLLLGYRLHCVTLGESAPFDRSVPRFLRTVAESYNVELDGIEIDLSAQPVQSREEADDLVTLLTDPLRKTPVVGISMDDISTQNTQLFEADRLAKDVFGSAHVRVLSCQATFQLTDRIGKRFSVFNGAARIWWPNVQPDRDNPYDHPLWLADRIRDDGMAATRRAMTDRLLRASAGRHDADDAVPSFAEARRIASTVLRENVVKSGRDTADLLPLYEAENKDLIKQMKENKDEYTALLAIDDEDLKIAKADRDEARTEIFALRTRLDEMEKAIRQKEHQPDIEIPESFENLLAWVTLYLHEKVELLPRALNAAKKTVFDNPPLAYRALLLLHDAYVPMKSSGAQGAKERWESGLRQLGLECSPTHSGTRAGENANDYFVSYDGRKTEIDMHLKGSNSRDPRYCFRIYFFWAEEKGRVVIASLPSHLESRIS